MTRVKSLNHLKKLAGNGHGFFIALKFGLRSSKHIRWSGKQKRFYVEHYIDGTRQSLAPADLGDRSKSNIGEAMMSGALYAE